MQSRAIFLSSSSRITELNQRYDIQLPGYLLNRFVFELTDLKATESNYLQALATEAEIPIKIKYCNRPEIIFITADIEYPQNIKDKLLLKSSFPDMPVSVSDLLMRIADREFPKTQISWKTGSRQLDFSKAPLIMGILNVTPDSFSDGGRYADKAAAVQRALQMAEQGADIIDIGGESTRPGSETVPKEEEIGRVIPVIEAVRAKSPVLISIDTYKADVARLALQAGADIINDISGACFDPEMPAVAVEFDCPIIIMHIKGTPKNMQKDPHYEDVMFELYRYFEERITSLTRAGVHKIIIDPGIGFGKRLIDNFTILRDLRDFTFLKMPLMIGASRKSFIGLTLNKEVDQRLSGSLAAHLLSLQNGVQIIRVHDVMETKDVVEIYRAVQAL